MKVTKMKQGKIKQLARRGCLLLVWLLMVASIAQAQGTTRYVYDDNGRLRAVIAPNGEANVYEYDPAGNITAIRRNDATTLEIFDFSPREGAPGTQVTIFGSGFGTGVSVVSFNGATSQIVSSNGQQAVVTVPSAATTGTISVTAAGKFATSPRPFVVRGIMVTPATADVMSRREIQFTATAVAMEDKNVKWSVDGIEGGLAATGNISDTGLYGSPLLSSTQARALFRVRATSVSEPNFIGESLVTVRNPEFYPEVYAPFVSVFNGSPPNIYSGTVSILNGNANNQIGENLFSPIVSILNGTSNNQIAANLFTQPVSVSKGPGVTSVSPLQLTRGATTTLTLNGLNLNGTTEILFLNVESNTVDTTITASGITVNPSGTSLTANVNVNAGASLGQRFVVVKTSSERSPLGRIGINTIEVIP